jgi:hypothetical protein
MPFGVEVLIFWRIPAVHLGQYLDGTDSIRRFDIPQIQKTKWKSMATCR